MDTLDGGTSRGGSGAYRMPRIVSFLLTIAAVLCVSLAIAWPLWSLASSSASAYSLTFASTLAATVVLLFALRARRRRRDARRRTDRP